MPSINASFGVCNAKDGWTEMCCCDEYSKKGAEVVQRSKGLAGEAMRGNVARVEPPILKVDASKSSLRQQLET